jgi:hypothetical protein
MGTMGQGLGAIREDAGYGFSLREAEPQSTGEVLVDGEVGGAGIQEELGWHFAIEDCMDEEASLVSFQGNGGPV